MDDDQQLVQEWAYELELEHQLQGDNIMKEKPTNEMDKDKASPKEENKLYYSRIVDYDLMERMSPIIDSSELPIPDNYE